MKQLKIYILFGFCFGSIISTNLAIAQGTIDSTLEIGTSPNPVGSGARAMGQGNAFIAIADDATSASWNPGGLSQLEKPEISLAYEYISRRESINSTFSPISETEDTIDFSDLNFASIVIPYFYGRNMVFSLNYLNLYSFDKSMSFPFSRSESFPGFSITKDITYTLDQEGAFSVIAPAFGIDVTPKLALGITLNIWNHSITDNSSYTRTQTEVGTKEGKFQSGNTTTTPTSVVTRDDFTVDSGYSVVLGGLYRINKAWAVGMVIKPYFELNLDHFHVENNIDIPNQVPTSSRAEIEFPWIIGTGFAWRPSDELTVSMDVTWTDWSDYTIREKNKGEEVNNPVTGTVLRKGKLKDTFTVRLGSEYLFILDKYLIPLRMGFGYDPSPAVDETDNLYTANLGIGVQIKEKVNLDLAYEYRWGKDTNGSSLGEFNDTGISGTQDISRHRVLTSLIYYF